ncbi:MAG: BON domain-containing protein [Verrucomicrobiota bacterium]
MNTGLLRVGLSGRCLMLTLALALGAACAATHRGQGKPSQASDGEMHSTNYAASSIAPEVVNTANSRPVASEPADSTAQNRREAEKDTVTPLDQGNGDLDLGITQSIRKAVVGDRQMSFLAKNVKIITVNGEVTLRGVVQNETEKNAIGSLAEKTSGVKAVNNLLSVKQSR